MFSGLTLFKVWFSHILRLRYLPFFGCGRNYSLITLLPPLTSFMHRFDIKPTVKLEAHLSGSPPRVLHPTSKIPFCFCDKKITPLVVKTKDVISCYSLCYSVF